MRRASHPVFPSVIALVILLALAGFVIAERQHGGKPRHVLRETVDRGLSPDMKKQFETKLEETLAEIKKTESAGGRDISQYLVLGNAYYSLGRLGEAASAYRTILSTNPNDAPSLQNLGQAELEMGDEAGAEDSWSRSLRIDQNEDYYIRLANVIDTYAPRRPEDVRKTLENGITAIGQTYGLLYRLAQWYEKQGEWDSAASHYEVAQQLAGDKSLQKKIEEMRLKALRHAPAPK